VIFVSVTPVKQVDMMPSAINERCINCIGCRRCIECFNCQDCSNCKFCIGIDGGENLEFVVYGVKFTELQYNVFIKQNELFQ
jgi:hypothetical protein